MSVLDMQVTNGLPTSLGLRQPRKEWGPLSQATGTGISADSMLEYLKVLRVLVVGSNAEIVDSTVQEVGQWAHNLEVAHDGYTALRIAASQHPQVVIIQIELGWMNGLTLARNLRTDFPRSGSLFIGIANSEDSKQRKLSIESGIDVLLVKPVRVATLETLLMLESNQKYGGLGQREKNQATSVR